MANEGYTGVPTVTPDVRQPDDYQRVQSSPADFGGAIAQGVEKAGQGAFDLSKFWGVVQANDEGNKAEQEGLAVAQHFDTLSGQDRLDAQASTAQQLEEIRQKHKGNLATPESQLRYETQTTPFFNRFLGGKVSTAAIDAGKEVANTVATNSYLGATNMAAVAGSDGDWGHVLVAREKALDAQVALATHNGMERDPNTIQQAQQKADYVWKSAIEARAVQNPEDALAKLKDPRYGLQEKLGVEYTPLLERTQAMADRHFGPTGNAAANAAVPPPGSGASVPTAPKWAEYNGHLNGGDVQSALRLSEGLRTEPYWDVNHWRIGYGSDTITRADGTSETVGGANGTNPNIKPAVNITAADADRDLQRRTGMAADTASKQIGGSTWGALSPGAKSALTSVVYNYGHLPTDVANAALTGNTAALAQAVAHHAGDNGGVNAPRRLAEASAILGKGANLGSWSTLVSSAPGAQASDLSLQEPASGNAPETPTVTPATASGPPPPSAAVPPPGQPSETTQVDLDAWLAHKAAWVEQQPWSQGRQESTIAVAQKQYMEMGLALGANAKAKRDLSDAATEDVLGLARQGKYGEAYAKLNNYDPRVLPAKEKDALEQKLLRDSGTDNPNHFGSGYASVMKRIVLPPTDPNFVGSYAQLLQLENDGQLTRNGSKEIWGRMQTLRKGTSEGGMQTQYNHLLDALTTRLVGGVDYKGEPKNLKGKDLLETSGIAQFNNKWDEYQEQLKQGKGQGGFDLADPKKMDAFADMIYPRQQREYDKVHDAPPGEEVPEAPGTPLPSPPEGFGKLNETGWGNLMTTYKGNHYILADKIKNLLEDPNRLAPVWDAHFGTVLPAEQIFRQIGFTPPPPVREGPEVRKPDTTNAPSSAAQGQTQEQSPEAAHATESIKKHVGDFLRMLPTLGAPDLAHMTPEQMRQKYGVKP